MTTEFTDFEITGALAIAATENPAALPLMLQLLGAVPCEQCLYIKNSCRCSTLQFYPVSEEKLNGERT